MSVYVIGASEGPLKVGFAIDPEQRLRELQTGNPASLYLLAARDGDRRAEAAFHLVLADHRVRGEWFRRNAVARVFDLELPATEAGYEWPGATDMCAVCQTDWWPWRVREDGPDGVVADFRCSERHVWSCWFSKGWAEGLVWL